MYYLLQGNFSDANQDIFRVIATTAYKCQMFYCKPGEKKKTTNNKPTSNTHQLLTSRK